MSEETTTTTEKQERDPSLQQYLESIVNSTKRMLDRHIEEILKNQETIDNN